MNDSLLHRAIETRHSHEFVRYARDAIPSASAEELSAYIFATIVPTSVYFSQAIAQVIDFYVDAERIAERAEIVRLASSLEESGSSEKIMNYVREALRKSQDYYFSVYGQVLILA